MAKRSYRDVAKEGKNSAPSLRPTIRSVLQYTQKPNVVLEHIPVEAVEGSHRVNPTELEDIRQSMWAN